MIDVTQIELVGDLNEDRLGIGLRWLGVGGACPLLWLRGPQLLSELLAVDILGATEVGGRYGYLPPQ